MLLSVLLAASLPIISEKHCSLKLFIINIEEGGGECSLGHVLEALHYNMSSICGREEFSQCQVILIELSV